MIDLTIKYNRECLNIESNLISKILPEDLKHK